MKRLAKTLFVAIAGLSTIAGNLAPLHACGGGGGGGGGGRARSFGYGVARAHHHSEPSYAPQYSAPQYAAPHYCPQHSPSYQLQPNYLPIATMPPRSSDSNASFAGSLPPTVQRVASQNPASSQGFAARQPQASFGGQQFAGGQGQPAPQQAQGSQFPQGQAFANRQAPAQQRQVAQRPIGGAQPSFGGAQGGGQPQGGQPNFAGQAGTNAQPRRLSTQPVVQPRTVAGNQQQPQQQFAQQPVGEEAGALQSLGGTVDQQQFVSTPTQPGAQSPMDEAQSSALEALGGYADEQAPAEEAGNDGASQVGFENGSVPQGAANPTGNWSANLENGATVQLSLQEDGTFNWIAKSGDKSSSFSGSYSFESGSLTLIRSSDNQKLAGLMTPTEGQGFNFKLNGAKDSGLNFSRI